MKYLNSQTLKRKSFLQKPTLRILIITFLFLITPFICLAEGDDILKYIGIDNPAMVLICGLILIGILAGIGLFFGISKQLNPIASILVLIEVIAWGSLAFGFVPVIIVVVILVVIGVLTRNKKTKYDDNLSLDENLKKANLDYVIDHMEEIDPELNDRIGNLKEATDKIDKWIKGGEKLSDEELKEINELLEKSKRK